MMFMKFKLDRLLAVLSFAALVFLAFIIGGISTYYKYPPYQWINEAEMAKTAYKEKERNIKKAKEDKVIKVAKSEAKTFKEGTFKGYTLYTPIMSLNAVLIDMDGNVVHQWGKPFSELWPDPPHIKNPIPDSRVHFRDATVLPNGDLIGTIEGLGDTPYGYAMIKLDKDSNLIWKVAARMHHQHDIGEDGTVYGFSHHFGELSEKISTEYKVNNLLQDWLMILSPDGVEKERVSISEMLADSDFNYLLQDRLQHIAKGGAKAKRDVTHTNAVMVLTHDMAKHFPMFNPGDLLISIRHIGLIMVVDGKTHKIKWGTVGPWKGQHDARFLTDGTILLFDNLGGGKQQSRIIKYHLDTKQAEVIFKSTEGLRFFTQFRGMNRELPNGNFLLAEAGAGRLFEINAKGEVLWEFKDPYLQASEKKNKKNKKERRTITSTKRYAADQLPFLQQK
jgi:hypothetical protein